MAKKKILLSLFLLMAGIVSTAAKPPRLVINLVVGTMQADDIDRYQGQFTEEGFLRLKKGGADFTGASYD